MIAIKSVFPWILVLGLSLTTYAPVRADGASIGTNEDDPLHCDALEVVRPPHPILFVQPKLVPTQLDMTALELEATTVLRRFLEETEDRGAIDMDVHPLSIEHPSGRFYLIDEYYGRYLVFPDQSVTKYSFAALLSVFEMYYHPLETDDDRLDFARALALYDIGGDSTIVSRASDIPGCETHPVTPDLACAIRAPFTANRGGFVKGYFFPCLSDVPDKPPWLW